MSQERSSKTREPQITIAERRELLDFLIEVAKLFQDKAGVEEERVFRTYWGQLESRLLLLAMDGVLMDQISDQTSERSLTLKPQEIAHLRRLIALEVDSIPEDLIHIPYIDGLIEDTKARVKDELAEVEFLNPDDLSDWPRTYKNAYADLDILRRNL